MFDANHFFVSTVCHHVHGTSLKNIKVRITPANEILPTSHWGRITEGDEHRDISFLVLNIFSPLPPDALATTTSGHRYDTHAQPPQA